MDVVHCPHCGKELPPEMQFCPYCMERIDEPAAVSADELRPTRQWKNPNKTTVLLTSIALCAVLAASLCVGLFRLAQAKSNLPAVTPENSAYSETAPTDENGEPITAAPTEKSKTAVYSAAFSLPTSKPTRTPPPAAIQPTKMPRNPQQATIRAVRTAREQIQAHLSETRLPPPLRRNRRKAVLFQVEAKIPTPAPTGTLGCRSPKPCITTRWGTMNPWSISARLPSTNAPCAMKHLQALMYTTRILTACTRRVTAGIPYAHYAINIQRQMK